MATGTLTSSTIAATYKSLMKVKGGANAVLHATTHALLEDGDGNDSVLSLAQDSVGITGSGKKLYFHDKGGEWISGDGTNLTITGGTEINLDCTTLDINAAADISGALTCAAITASGASQFNNTVTVGVDGTGKDVKFFGDTLTNGYMLWDQSQDDLILGSVSKFGIGITAPGTSIVVQNTTVDSGYDASIQSFGNHSQTDPAYGAGSTGGGFIARNLNSTVGNFSGIYFYNSSDYGCAGVSGVYTGHSSGSGAKGELAFMTRDSSGHQERMRIDEDGLVGIGTDDPDAILHINSGDAVDDATLLILQSAINNADEYNEITFKVAGDVEYGAIRQYIVSGGSELRFAVTDDVGSSLTERMTINKDGNVGIGTDVPTVELEIASDGASQIKFTRAEDSITSGENLGGCYWDMVDADFATDRDTCASIVCYATETHDTGNFGCEMKFAISDNTSSSWNTRLTIKEDGDFIGSASANISDVRLKQNITSLTGSLDKINQLNGVSFTWKPEARKNVDKTYLGLIAQEVEGIFPDAVRDESVHDTESTTYKSIEYTALIAPMIQAIQELSAKVEALENA